MEFIRLHDAFSDITINKICYDLSKILFHTTKETLCMIQVQVIQRLKNQDHNMV